MGGSTTSLLAFLGCFDKSEYDVDLQLYRSRIALLSAIPQDVCLLPLTAKYGNKQGQLTKAINSYRTVF